MSLGPVLFLLFLLPVAIVSPSALTVRTSSTVLASTGDFSLSASPSAISISQGGAAASTITVSGQGVYSGNVTFSIAETYDSINIRVSTTPSFVAISVAQPSATLMLQISTYNGVRPGNYTIPLEGYDGIIQHSFQVHLQVTGQDFAITSSPTRLTFPVRQNTTQTASIIVSSLGGFTGDVNLTISVGSYFPGVTQEPSASLRSMKVSITPSVPMSFPLAISVNSSMVAAPYQAQVTGVARTTSGVSRGGGFNIVIGPDYNMTSTVKNLIVHQGAWAVATLTFTSLNGFAGGVNMYAGTISVNPPNPDIPVYPADTLLSSGGTNITRIVAKADSRTGLGTYSVWIETTADTGWVAESMPFNVTVEGPLTGPDFTIYANPVHLSTSLGSTVTSTVNLVGTNGFTGPLNLFTAYGIGASLNPRTVSLIPLVNVTSTLTVNVPLNRGQGGGYTLWWFASGVYSTLVIASDPTGLAHGAWVNVTATPFTVVASPASQGLKAGSTAKFNVAVNGIGQFNNTVTLSARVLYANPVVQIGGSTSDATFFVTATLSKSMLNFSGAPTSLNSNLTVTVLSGTPDADYAIWITATYLRPEYICPCAPKDALAFTVPVHLLVTSDASASPTIFGLQPIEFYGIVAALGAGVAILASYLVVWRKKPNPFAQC